MSEQSEFLKKIEELNELAADQENVIFMDQLLAIFPEAEGNEERIKLLTDYLKEKRIGVDEKIDADEFMTEDEKNYLEYYLEDLKPHKLSDDQKNDLRKKAISGDEEAAMKVLNDYLVNVVDIAKLYTGQGVLIEDLIGEANIALVGALEGIGALEEADDVDGFFSKICMDAMQDIIASRLDELSEDEKLVKKVNKVSKAAKELYALLGRKVTVDELCEESGLSRASVIKAIKLTANNIEEIDYIEDEQ